MAAEKLSDESMRDLISLLERRLEVIADHKMRDSDPDGQLALLQEVSEQITSFHQRHEGALSPRLNHFLGNCSFDKALEWAQNSLEQ